jgi:hypothetical protein
MRTLDFGRPLYIFDLDGTLRNCQHRTPMLANTDDPDRWRKFYAACDGDTPIPAVIAVMESLYDSGADIFLFSGCSEEVRLKTLVWLNDHTTLDLDYIDNVLTMRAEKDYRPDDVIKQEMLNNMLTIDRERLVAVFDDRDRVVAMWRRNGIQCFQVAPGDF